MRENLLEVDYLEREGFEVFWDQKLRLGQVWKEVLHEGIKSGGKVLICPSAECEVSRCYAEIRELVDKARTILPGDLSSFLYDCRSVRSRVSASTPLPHSTVFIMSICYLNLSRNEALQAIAKILRNDRKDQCAE